MYFTKCHSIVINLLLGGLLVLPGTVYAHKVCKDPFGSDTELCPHIHPAEETQTTIDPVPSTGKNKKNYKAVALAWNRNGDVSWASRKTVESAKKAALDHCNKYYGNCNGANVFVQTNRFGCVAVARSGKSLYSSIRYKGDGNSKDAALKSCRKDRGNCKIAIHQCNYNVSFGKKKATAGGSRYENEKCSTSVGCSMTLNVQNKTNSKIEYKYYRNGIAHNYVYSVYPGQKNTNSGMQCRSGQKYCIGAWSDSLNKQWGVGKDGKQKCSNCCTTCTGGIFSFNALTASSGSALKAASPGNIQTANPKTKQEEGYDYDYGAKYNEQTKTSPPDTTTGGQKKPPVVMPNQGKKTNMSFKVVNKLDSTVWFKLYNDTTRKSSAKTFIEPFKTATPRYLCREKDVICYGAEPVSRKLQDKYWGVGGGTMDCKEYFCCFSCDGRLREFVLDVPEIEKESKKASSSGKTLRSKGRMGITVENKTDRDMNIDIMVNKDRSQAQKTEVKLDGVNKAFIECKDEDLVCIGAYHDDLDNLFEWGMGKKATQCLINNKCCVRCNSDSHKFVIDSYAIN